MNKSYEELKKKSEEKLEGHDDLKRAAFNHVVAKLENANEDKEGDDISDLKNAFPLTNASFSPTRSWRTKIP